MKSFGSLIVLLALSLSAHGGEKEESFFLPENNLQIPTNQFISSEIEEEDFYRIIGEVEDVYQPVVAARGKELVVKKLWSNDTVNASAQQLGNKWIVNMYGGLARHDRMTKDGFALVVCHELGHHLGGAPKISAWAANEGQSDYFATLKCFRKVYGDTNNLSFLGESAEINPVIQESCVSAHSEESQQALCVRSTLAGKTLGSLLAVLNNQSVPRVDTPDPSQVSRTRNSHPKAQCRLDTYFAGALCTANVNSELSDIDPNIGTCSRKFGDTVGVRPLCWYSPETDLHLANY